MTQSNTSRTSRDSLRISSVEPPGWSPAGERLPAVGEHVYCTEGPAKVVRVLGRTSDGSRLLELRCDGQPQPFFASSSNILMRDGPEASPFLDESTAIGGG
ncbi:MAG: hypothetical protein AB7T31_10620 [Gemmatimonadales bacterium]